MLTERAWVMLRRAYGFIPIGLVLVGAMYHLHVRSEAMARLFEQRRELNELGNKMADASDYLTSEVRKFAQFGDPEHEKRYWREVYETRRRDEVLQRLRELNVPQDELDMMKSAKGNSDALIFLEKEAMELTRQKKFDEARKLLFLPHYDAAKARIMDPIAEFRQRARARSDAELAKAHRAEHLAFVVLFVSVLLVYVLALSLAFQRRELQSKLIFADRMAAVGTLAAGVAHEINNPLMYVTGNIQFAEEVLKERTTRSANEGTVLTPEEVVDVLAALREARMGADRVKVIVRDLKSFSRGDEENLRILDLHQVLESAIQMSAHEVRSRAQLVREYERIPSVMGNEARLAQVFLNLLVNAAQAIPEGKPSHNEIRIVTRPGPFNTAWVEVRDTGIGIAKDIRSRIFDPFFTTKPIGVGTGLGLPICHAILKSLGGEIQVESQVGRGSVFRVILPASSKDLEAVGTTEVEVPSIAARRRVLIVDDEPMVLTMLGRALASQHDVVTTMSGEDAIQRISRGERYDLILCDLMMPTTTGMDVHKAIGQTAPDQLHKFVFLTGGAFTPAAKQFLDRLSTPWLQKPVPIEQIRKLVAT